MMLVFHRIKKSKHRFSFSSLIRNFVFVANKELRQRHRMVTKTQIVDGRRVVAVMETAEKSAESGHTEVVPYK